ncbi:MAG: sugar phosphate nucleotidyltransferase [Deltaproteobacteria bacterium]|nr:sugar phosphate nucleotidyltransferase [Deltaproteobacteria bacterium]
MKVTKAVIPAAGLGTRMQPATKFFPKELLPIIAKPILFFVLEECENTGLNEVTLIVSQDKKPFFAQLPDFFPNLKLKFVIQEKAAGLGDAILTAGKEVGDNPFLILLPDIIIDGKKPVSRQLIEIFQETKKSVNATEHTSPEIISSYGVYDIASSKGKLHLAKGVVEKPPLKEATSDFTVTGRYLFTPDIFEILRKTKPGRNGEIQLADAMNTLAKIGGLHAFEFEGTHLDAGTPQGYLKTIYYFGAKQYGKNFYQGIA